MSLLSREQCFHSDFMFHRMSRSTVRICLTPKKQLFVDMNHAEIFELCESSAKLQCPDCNAFSEIGIFHCSSGRNLKYSRSPATLQKTNCDFTSLPGFLSLRGIPVEDLNMALLEDR